MKTRTKIIIMLIPLVLAAIVFWRLSSTDQAAASVRRQTATLVRVEAPKREAIVHALQLTGDMVPIQQAQVFARVYGNLESIKADMGDFVKEDQLLAVVDTTELAQQYRQAAATFTNDSAVYERSKMLLDRNLIAQQDYDNATANMKVAAANLDAARTKLEYAKITAPFSGYITRRFLDPGALLTSTNATLFNLMDVEVMKIIVNVLEKDIPSIRLGTKAVITVDAYPDKQFDGSIARISGAVDLSTRTMPIEIDIPNRDHLLKPGMFARVALIIGDQQNALTVPTMALLKDPTGYYVFVADKGVARRKSITVGAEQNSRTEILSGLDENDNIITTGQQFARDNGPVTVQP